MKKPLKKWSIVTAINLFLVVWFAFLTNYCQSSMRQAQQADPLPDDYVGALVLLLLGLTAVVFGILFLISLLILIISFVKNKYFAKSETNEKPEL